MKKILLILVVIFFAAVSVSAQDVESDPTTEIFDETTILLDDTDTAAPALEANSGKFFTTWDFIKVILILIAVILVVYGIFFALKKAGGGSRFQSDELIRLLGSQSLTQNGSVHLIEVGARYYLVGCGDGTVSHIADIDDKETVDEIMLKKPSNVEGKKTFTDFFNFKIGKKEPAQKDLTEKVRNNNKYMHDQAERLKKM